MNETHNQNPTQLITVLMGVPGAGKTTWLNRQSLDGIHVASTEPVRKDKSLDVDGFMNWLRRSAREAVAQGLSVISDGTNIDPRHRAFWLGLAKDFDVQTRLVIFKTDLQLCLDAQKIRTAPVASNLVRTYHWDMSKAMRYVQSEAWDTIEVITRNLGRY